MVVTHDSTHHHWAYQHDRHRCGDLPHNLQHDTGMEQTLRRSVLQSLGVVPSLPICQGSHGQGWQDANYCLRLGWVAVGYHLPSLGVRQSFLKFFANIWWQFPISVDAWIIAKFEPCPCLVGPTFCPGAASHCCCRADILGNATRSVLFPSGAVYGRELFLKEGIDGLTVYIWSSIEGEKALH